jgi:transposase
MSVPHFSMENPAQFCVENNTLIHPVQISRASSEVLGLDPFCGAAFVLLSKRAHRIKVLIWDGTGLVLMHKRMQSAAFVWPQVRNGVLRMTRAHFATLFEGHD